MDGRCDELLACMLAWKMDPWNRERQMGHSNASRSIARPLASSDLASRRALPSPSARGREGTICCDGGGGQVPRQAVAFPFVAMELKAGRRPRRDLVPGSEEKGRRLSLPLPHGVMW